MGNILGIEISENIYTHGTAKKFNLIIFFIGGGHMHLYVLWRLRCIGYNTTPAATKETYTRSAVRELCFHIQ